MGGIGYMKKYFYVSEPNCQDGTFRVLINHDALRLYKTTGSFGVICARVCGLSYANYLRVCRDRYGAKIIGRNKKYPYCIFPDKIQAIELANFLNSKASEAMRGV